ncbi:MAG TPA: TldD/PmbA family protein [Gemmatimonadaceae bacterium]|nr:TldD/PmbA family protein [Gemmatimonadaceae bacterium]
MSFDTRDEMQALAKRVLAFSKADEARVTIRSGWTGQTRFAGGEITTSGSAQDLTITVVSTIGKKRASATTNVTEDESLRRTVDLSERLARLSPDDPELMPELGPQQYAAVQAFDQRTSALDADQRAQAVSALIAAARAVDPVQDLFVAGYLEANAVPGTAVATSKGLFAYHASTGVEISTTVRTPDGTGSGWAADGAREWGRLDLAALGRRAAQKAVASQRPQAIEPGRYTVILEPQAVNDLVPLLLGAFNARTAEEGRSPFSKRGTPSATLLGERIADERVTLYSDPADPELRGQPFDAEGLPAQRRVWIEKGVLKTLAYSRYWAQRRGLPESVAGGGGGGFGGGGGGLKMMGGDRSLEQLIAGTERGVLVTRNWYIRALDQRTLSFTGLTRDGIFLVEGGRIVRPLRNFRWNESPLTMLSRIEEIGRAERVGPGTVMPSLKVRDFNFASLSEAV